MVTVDMERTVAIEKDEELGSKIRSCDLTAN